MTIVTTGRIDINGQSNGCRQELSVSRSMPAIMENQMNQILWNQFCDEVDEALEPVNKAKKRLMTIMKLCGIFDVSMIILSFALFMSSFNNSSSSSGGSAAFLPFVFAVLSVFVMIPVNMWWAVKFSNQGLADLGKVCDKASAQNPGISFHVREEQHLRTQGNDVRVGRSNYIEVCVKSDAMTGTILPGEMQSTPIAKAMAIGPVASSVPAFNPAVVAAQPELDIESGTGKKSAAERMRSLDEMKGLLTEEEYQRKRAEILSDI